MVNAPFTVGQPYTPDRLFHNVFVPLGMLAHPGLSDGAKLLFGLLNYHGGKSGKFPKQKTLAEEMGVSVETIKRYLKELGTHGFIRSRQDGHRGKNNTYEFIWHDALEHSLRKRVSILAPCPVEQGVNSTCDRASNLAPNPGERVSILSGKGVNFVRAYKEEEVVEEVLKTEEEIKPPIVPHDVTLDGTQEKKPDAPNGALDFAEAKLKRSRKSGTRTTTDIEKALGDRLPWWEAFWKEYPCHDAKREAIDAFERKVHDRDTAMAVYRGAQAYRRKWVADPTMKLKYAQGWINGERWLDEVPEPPEGKTSQRFAEFWDLYPRKQRKDFACMEWLSVVTVANECEVFACLERYLASDEVARGVVANPDKWLYEQHRNKWTGTWPARRARDSRQQEQADAWGEA
jgi:hypothetical protein